MRTPPLCHSAAESASHLGRRWAVRDPTVISLELLTGESELCSMVTIEVRNN